jgi:hypothetical protein
MQLVRSESMYVPAAQTVHDAAAALALIVPEAHALQVVAPAALWVPAWHSLHTERPESMYMPAGQVVQMEEPAAEYLPSAQLAHEFKLVASATRPTASYVVPAPALRPGAHSWHDALSVAIQYPAGHMVQAVAAAEAA